LRAKRGNQRRGSVATRHSSDEAVIMSANDILDIEGGGLWLEL